MNTLQPALATREATTTTLSPWPVFWIASVASFLVSLDGTVLFAAFGALRASFPAASAADLSWVLNAYSVVFAAMLIPAGGIADRHGRKRIFLLGLVLYLLPAIACALAPGVNTLVAARAVQAVGAALVTPASLSLVLDAFPASKRAVAVSAWGAVAGLGAALGPSLGSLVVDALGWRWAFVLNLPLGLAALAYGRQRLRESARPDAQRAFDLIGMLLVIVGVGAIALAVVQLKSPHWSRAELAGVGGLGIAALVAFGVWVRTARAPLLDPALFRHATYRDVNLAMLAFGTAFAMMFFGFFFYMTGIWHYSLPQAGLAVTPGPLLVIPTAIVTGRLAARLGHRPFLLGGSLVYAASGLWLLLVPGTEPDYLHHWLPALVLSGVGVGLVMPSLAAAAVHRLPLAHYAVGGAVNQAVRQIGAVLGVAITVLLLGHQHLVRADFAPFYLGFIALALLTGVLCLRVDTRPA